MAISQILDDRDPAVVYSSGWLRAGSSNEFNATTSYANDPGLTASLVFQGIQVFVYGTLGPRNAQRLSPQSSYSVDGSTPVTYQAVQNPSVQYSVRFYVSPLLPNGQHTLSVTNLITSDSLFLDYFLVLRADDDTSPSQLVPVASTGKSASQTPTGAANAVEEKPSSNTGTIVGSAIGAAALVILAVAIMFWLRGRNKRTQGHDATVNSFREGLSIDNTSPMRQTPVQSVTAYQTSSDSATFLPQNSHAVHYDPYDPSSSAPPGYVPEVSRQSGPSHGRPSQILPSKFAQEYRSITSTRT